jgi:hypothetical protein
MKTHLKLDTLYHAIRTDWGDPLLIREVSANSKAVAEHLLDKTIVEQYFFKLVRDWDVLNSSARICLRDEYNRLKSIEEAKELLEDSGYKVSKNEQ